MGDSKKLRSEIDTHDIISFDIFDTLAMRITLTPEDVFLILENRAVRAGYSIDNFAQIRIDEQLKLFNPDLREIYAAVQSVTGITDEIRDKLMNLEIEIEKSVLIPRNSVAEAFHYAVESGKEVYIVSDMYIPAEILGDILAGMGIVGYRELIVSCDHKRLKMQGLFSVLGEKIGTGCTVLHVGDNPINDIKYAADEGFDTFWIASAVELYRKSLYAQTVSLDMINVNTRSLLGLFIARLYNDPFLKENGYDVYPVKTIEDFAYSYIAPLITSFVIWMYQQLGSDTYDGILFAARDGFLIKDLYELISRELSKDGEIDVQGYYFLTSRAAASSASITDEESLLRTLSTFRYGGMEEDVILEKRFGIVDGNKEPSHLIKRSEELRNNYQKYLDRLGIRPGGKYAFFDFVSAGTCQYHLSKMGSYCLEGLYFCRAHAEDAERQNLSIKSYFINEQLETAQSSLFRYYKLLEVIMSSDLPSLAFFNESGEPCYDCEVRNADTLEFLRKTHQAIKDFFGQYVRKLYIPGLPIDRKTADDILGLANSRYTDTSAIRIDQLVHADDWILNRSVLHDVLRDQDLYQEVTETERNMIQMIDQREDYAATVTAKDWETFYHFSRMREGILNWYDFSKEATVLEIGAQLGAITGLLCRRCNAVVSYEPNGVKAMALRRRYRSLDNLQVIEKLDHLERNHFDYVILIGGLERLYNKVNSNKEYAEYLKYLFSFLKDGGRLLFAVDNKLGTRYLSGTADQYTGKPFADINGNTEGVRGTTFTKAELEEILFLAGWGSYRFYYALPDYRVTQVVYTDAYMPTNSIRDRVTNYYVDKNSLVLDEACLYDYAIQNKMLDRLANSFLIEVSSDGCFADINCAIVSSDRAADSAFATVIRKDSVSKQPLYMEGRQALERLCRNMMDLQAHGVRVIDHTFTEGVLSMPFIKGKNLMCYLQDEVHQDSSVFFEVVDKLYDTILHSSEEANACDNALLNENNCHLDFGEILTEAYIDMIPYNCFYDQGEFIFYDQEFVRYNYPAKYILFRIIWYSYSFISDLESIIPMETAKERYGLTVVWDELYQEEERFIQQNRNQKGFGIFYSWVGVDRGIVQRNSSRLMEPTGEIQAVDLGEMPQNEEDEKCYVSKGAYDLESNETDRWNWVYKNQAEITVRNPADRNATYKITFGIAPAPEQDNRLVWISYCGREELYEAPDDIEISLTMEEGEEYIIKLRSEGDIVSLAEDPRFFAFSVLNLQMEECQETSNEELKRIQDVEFSLLKDIKEVCERHSINFVLFYGTLLGAVRHKGFIPWDDDADVALLREDYDRLLPILRRELSRTHIISSQEDGGEFYGGYAKMCSKGTPQIWIDLLPLDRVSDNADEFREQLERINAIQEQLFVKVYKKEGARRVHKGALYELGIWLKAFLLPGRRLKKMLYREMTRYSNSNSKNVAVLGRYLTVDRQIVFDRDGFENPVNMCFEDDKMPVPASYDEVLREMYGERYMAFAKKSLRCPRHFNLKKD